MGSVSITVLFTVLALGLFAGCSATGPVTSEREALTRRIERIEAARAARSEYPEPTAVRQLSPAPSIGGGPLSGFPGNTLVVLDAEVDWWSRRQVCTRMHEQRSSATAINCGNEGVGARSPAWPRKSPAGWSGGRVPKE